MIDPKELRIGNLVQYQDQVIVVDQVGKNCILHERNGMSEVIICIGDFGDQLPGLDISPIPITPEWLERLGLEKVVDYYDLDFNGGGLRFLSNLDECRLFTGSEYSLRVAMDYDTCEIPNTPKYVHQLQNLYHALTGQELEVKEMVK
jgi:hypothetical protein